MDVGDGNGNLLAAQNAGGKGDLDITHIEVVDNHLGAFAAAVLGFGVFALAAATRGLGHVLLNGLKVGSAATQFIDDIGRVDDDFPDVDGFAGEGAEIHRDLDLANLEGMAGLESLGVADEEVLDADFPRERGNSHAVQGDRGLGELGALGFNPGLDDGTIVHGEVDKRRGDDHDDYEHCKADDFFQVHGDPPFLSTEGPNEGSKFSKL